MSTLAKYITEKKLFDTGRVFIAPTKAKDVVTIEGSVYGGANMLPRALQEVPLLATELFDAGTKLHSKEVLRDSLAARGASLSFAAGGDRTYFSGSCLPEDLPFLLQTIEECLSAALFQATELSSTRDRLLGRLQEEKTDTRMQASAALSRILYDEKHVNYAEKDAYQEKILKAVTRKDLVSFQKMIGKGGLVLAIVGDVEATSALKAAERSFGKLSRGTLESAPKNKNTKITAAETKHISIAEKTNIDMYLGAVLPLTYDHADFLPVAVVTDMLGGGFAAHLMQTVRERDGLTYGIRSLLTGFGKDTEGSFRIWSTFSPDLYEKGVATIRKEVKNFFSTGITTEALSKRKDEMTGSYVIGLSTTRGLAGMLHKIGMENKPLSYIDNYPELVKALSLKEVKNAAEIIPINKLSLTAAGTFAK